MLNLGDVISGKTIYVPFSTNDGSGGRVEPSAALVAADFRIYKNGSATQRSSESGFTVTSPFDTMVGIQWLAIDLSDNTDAGFYSVGDTFHVVLYTAKTIDSQSISLVLAQFTIEANNMYPDGYLYYDAAASNTNSVEGTDGTRKKPVSNLTALTTLGTSTGIKKVMVKGSLTLNAATVDYTFDAWDGTATLIGSAGMDLDDCILNNVKITTGLASNDNTVCNNCLISGITTDTLRIDGGTFNDCTWDGNIEFEASGGYREVLIKNGKGGLATPTFDFTAAPLGMVVDGFSGRVSFANVSDASAWVEFFSDGGGDIVLAASCTGGSFDPIGQGYIQNSSAGTTVTLTKWIDTSTLRTLINFPTGIKKNTALNNFQFVMVDSNNDPVDSISVTGTRKIDGGAYGALDNTVSFVSNGTYQVNLTADDLNGDIITLRFEGVGAKTRLITIKTNT